MFIKSNIFFFFTELFLKYRPFLGQLNLHRLGTPKVPLINEHTLILRLTQDQPCYWITFVYFSMNSKATLIYKINY